MVPNYPPCPSVMCRGVSGCALCWLGPFLRVGWFWRFVCSLPPALFCPLARRWCPLFSSSCLSRFTRLRPGVCVSVCNIWTDVKLLLLHGGHGTKAHPSCCANVRAILFIFRSTWHRAKPRTPPRKVLFNCMLWDSVPDGSLQWSSSCLVCVWNIWKDVKLLIDLRFEISRFCTTDLFSTAGGHRRPIELCPTKLSMVSLGYPGWSPGRTRTRFETISLSWDVANPKTTMPLGRPRFVLVEMSCIRTSWLI